MLPGKGIVLRDLKPENVLLKKDEKRLYLTDFGTVRQVSGMPTGTFALFTIDWSPPECIIPKVVEQDENGRVRQKRKG